MFDLAEKRPLLFILVAQGPSLQRTRIVGNLKKPNGGCLNIYGSEIRQKGVISSDKSSFCTSHRSTKVCKDISSRRLRQLLRGKLKRKDCHAMLLPRCLLFQGKARD